MADEKRDEYGLSAEDIQKIQEYRRTHDFTGNMSLQRNYQYEGEAADAFVRSKNCIKKSWEEKLYTDFGINRPIKNFSEDYPLNFLEEANCHVNPDNTDSCILDNQIYRFLSMVAQSALVKGVSSHHSDYFRHYCHSDSLAVEKRYLKNLKEG